MRWVTEGEVEQEAEREADAWAEPLTKAERFVKLVLAFVLIAFAFGVLGSGRGTPGGLVLGVGAWYGAAFLADRPAKKGVRYWVMVTAGVLFMIYVGLND